MIINFNGIINELLDSCSDTLKVTKNGIIIIIKVLSLTDIPNNNEVTIHPK